MENFEKKTFQIGLYSKNMTNIRILELICILRFPSMTLTVEIISGQHIPKPKGATEGEVVDPYIEVIMDRLFRIKIFSSEATL